MCLADGDAEIFAVTEIQNRGFGVVATRHIDKGERICLESASLVGPSNGLSCLECLRYKGDEDAKCKSCHFALCSSCQKKTSLVFHTAKECDILKKIEGPKKIFNFVFPLRFALLKSAKPDLYSRLVCLESHLERRLQQTGEVTKSLMEMSKLLNLLLPEISVKEAQQIVAILFTNGFELSINDIYGRALYDLVSRLNHSCVPNASHLNQLYLEQHEKGNEVNNNARAGNFAIEVTAQRAIPKGQEITIRYTSVYQGFIQRQKTFRTEWFFRCQCPRCEDPSEFGTYSSAIKCMDCRIGRVIPFDGKAELVIDPKLIQCSECSKECRMDFAAGIEEDVERHMTLDDPEIDQMMELLSACTNMLHDNHNLVMSLKTAILNCNLNSGSRGDSDVIDLLSMQEQYAKDILKYLEILDPGTTWRKNHIFLRLRAIVMQLTKLQIERKNTEKADLKKYLQDVKDIHQATEKCGINQQ